jgi:hypothetical protein
MVKIGLFHFPLKLFGGVFKTYGNGGWCHDLAFFFKVPSSFYQSIE